MKRIWLAERLRRAADWLDPATATREHERWMVLVQLAAWTYGRRQAWTSPRMLVDAALTKAHYEHIEIVKRWRDP